MVLHELLENCILFSGISSDELASMLPCLAPKTRHYKRNEIILSAGDKAPGLGIIVNGGANVEYNDFWGNKSILSHLFPGHIFAETYACIPTEPLMIQVVATEESRVVFLDAAHILGICPKQCVHHTRLVRNLLSVQAEKNLMLSMRIKHTSAKSIRGRLLSYLSEQAMRQNSQSFDIPFNRQALADYLGVDRSAMSNELSKMQREGLLSLNKNHFVLKKDAEEALQLQH